MRNNKSLIKMYEHKKSSKEKKVMIFAFDPIEKRNEGFVMKMHDSITPPIKNQILKENYKLNDQYKLSMYLYVITKEQLCNGYLNIPMVKTVLIKNEFIVGYVWLHFVTYEKYYITNENFDQYIDKKKKMKGYFCVDYYNLNHKNKKKNRSYDPKKESLEDYDTLLNRAIPTCQLACWPTFIGRIKILSVIALLIANYLKIDTLDEKEKEKEKKQKQKQKTKTKTKTKL